MKIVGVLFLKDDFPISYLEKFKALDIEFIQAQETSADTSAIVAKKKELRDYIYWYNHKRIKAKLKGLSPVNYRIQSMIS